MVRKLLSVVAGLLLAIGLGAQNHTLTLQLQDAATGEAVGFATVSVTPAKGQAKYTLSGSDGKATLEKVRTGTYTLKAELMGYKPYVKELELNADANLGIIKMEQDLEVLDAASVSAVGNPIIVKKDTVEYNASSFKISDDNMLVDLLKKLPGIEVAEDGTITSNGETVKKITIDGKTFFLDDPQLASSNLPAKLIEKVKVIKKKSEQAEFTGIDDGNDETIIDLSVQKGMMNGIFGNLTAGGGHDIPSQNNDLNDWRFTGNGMVGRFTEGSQLSLILNANNANAIGFGNFSGNMMGAMMGGMMGRGGGGFGGGGFGGGSGITTSWMGGANASMDLLDKKMEFAANYTYNGSNTSNIQDSYKETYRADGSSIINQTNSDNTQSTYGHRVGMRIDHKFSENTSLMIQPQFSFGGGSYLQRSIFDTWNNEMTAANLSNNGFSNNSGVNRNLQANGRALLRQRLGMPGRTLSLNVDWNITNNKMDGYNQSLTNTYVDGQMGTDLVNQRIDQVTKQQSLGARLVYTEPLGNYFYLEGSYQVNWSNSSTEKKVYNSDVPFDYYMTLPMVMGDIFMNYKSAGETYDPTYSNSVITRNLNQNIGMAFMYQNGNTRAQLGASAIPTNQYNLTNGKEYNPGTIWNFAPRAMLFYDFTENANVRLFYNGRSGQPSTSQLNPVLDNSNPLSLALGNPYLEPYFTHNLRTELEYSNRASFFTARLNLGGGMNQNPITSANWYDKTNRQYSFPINGRNTYNANASLMVNAPIAKSNFSISNTTNLNYSSTSSYIGATSLDMGSYFMEDGNFNYEKFHQNYFVDNPDQWTRDFLANETRTLNVTENLRGTYRSDNVEVILGARTTVRKPWYTVQSAVATTWNNAITGSFTWTVGRSGWELRTDANYRWYEGYTTDQPSEFVWNASISKQILKRQATIALRAYDILGQARAQNVAITDNYYQETHNNPLGRYILVSFTWRFGTFGGNRGRGGFRPGAGGPPMGGGGFGGGGFGGRRF